MKRAEFSSAGEYFKIHYGNLNIFTSLHFTSLHFTSLHFTSLHFTSLHFTSLHFTSLRFASLHFASLHFTSLHFTSLHLTSPHSISFHFISFHFISFHFISFHFISGSSQPLYERHSSPLGFLSSTQHLNDRHSALWVPPTTSSSLPWSPTSPYNSIPSSSRYRQNELGKFTTPAFACNGHLPTLTSGGFAPWS